MMMNKMVFFTISLLLVCVLSGLAGAATVAEQCNDAFEKVSACLTFATGKAGTPTKECCEGVAKMKQDEPVCLCYFIQQTHNGSQQIKSLGIQEERLLQLPTACKLSNASISDCPKLLNIPVSSPDYAIFTNTSISATPTTTSPVATDDSSGSENGVPSTAGVLMAVATVAFLSVFPAGVVSSVYT